MDGVIVPITLTAGENARSRRISVFEVSNDFFSKYLAVLEGKSADDEARVVEVFYEYGDDSVEWLILEHWYELFYEHYEQEMSGDFFWGTKLRRRS